MMYFKKLKCPCVIQPSSLQIICREKKKNELRELLFHYFCENELLLLQVLPAQQQYPRKQNVLEGTHQISCYPQSKQPTQNKQKCKFIYQNNSYSSCISKLAGLT